MKVRAKVGKESQLTRGSEYCVLGLDDRYFRVLNDRGSPALYPRRAFEVVDDNVPADWVWRRYADGEFHANPPELSKRGFYERYFDDDDDAIRVFNGYVKRMNIIPGGRCTE